MQGGVLSTTSDYESPFINTNNVNKKIKNNVDFSVDSSIDSNFKLESTDTTTSNKNLSDTIEISATSSLNTSGKNIYGFSETSRMRKRAPKDPRQKPSGLQETFKRPKISRRWSQARLTMNLAGAKGPTGRSRTAQDGIKSAPESEEKV